MPAGATYEPITTTTLSSFTTVTFSSLGTYTDIRVIAIGIGSTSSSYFCLRFNGDTAANYYRVRVAGDGASASTQATSADTSIFLNNQSTLQTQPGLVIADIFSYRNAKFKNVLSQVAQDKSGSGSTERIQGMWASTSAITSLTIFTPGGTISNGSITLYGITAA